MELYNFYKVYLTCIKLFIYLMIFLADLEKQKNIF